MDVSIVVPLFNEEESLPELCAWIQKVAEENNFTYEIILIDDGSTDDSWQVIENLISNHFPIKGIKFQRNYGKSAALNEGFKAAIGDVVITMDADWNCLLLNRSIQSLLFFSSTSKGSKTAPQQDIC